MIQKGWLSPIVAVVAAGVVWSCAGGAKSPGAAPAPAPAKTPGASPAPAPASDLRSTQSGVFTEAQATKGKDVYAGQCVSCHQGDHIGSQFRRHWNGKALSSLFALITETMPQDNPGSLAREDYVNVIAYLLKANGNPAGTVPLPDDSLALTKIRLDTLAAKR